MFANRRHYLGGVTGLRHARIPKRAVNVHKERYICICKGITQCSVVLDNVVFCTNRRRGTMCTPLPSAVWGWARHCSCIQSSTVSGASMRRAKPIHASMFYMLLYRIERQHRTDIFEQVCLRSSVMYDVVCRCPCACVGFKTSQKINGAKHYIQKKRPWLPVRDVTVLYKQQVPCCTIHTERPWTGVHEQYRAHKILDRRKRSVAWSRGYWSVPRPNLVVEVVHSSRQTYLLSKPSMGQWSNTTIRTVILRDARRNHSTTGARPVR